MRIVASKSLRHRWHDLSPQIGGLCDEAGIETSLSMRDRGEVLPRDGIKETNKKLVDGRHILLDHLPDLLSFLAWIQKFMSNWYKKPPGENQMATILEMQPF